MRSQGHGLKVMIKQVRFPKFTGIRRISRSFLRGCHFGQWSLSSMSPANAMAVLAARWKLCENPTSRQHNSRQPLLQVHV